MSTDSRFKFAPGTISFLRGWAGKKTCASFEQDKDKILFLFSSTLKISEFRETFLLFPVGKSHTRIRELVCPGYDVNDRRRCIDHDYDYDFSEYGPYYLSTRVHVGGQHGWGINVLMPKSFVLETARQYPPDEMVRIFVKRVHDALMEPYWERRHQLQKERAREKKELVELGRMVRDGAG